MKTKVRATLSYNTMDKKKQFYKLETYIVDKDSRKIDSYNQELKFQDGEENANGLTEIALVTALEKRIDTLEINNKEEIIAHLVKARLLLIANN